MLRLVLVLVSVLVLMVLITCSHCGAASWDSYRDGLSTHQFYWKYTIFDFDLLTMTISLAAKRLPHRRLVGQGSMWGVGPAGLSIELAGGRSVAY